MQKQIVKTAIENFKNRKPELVYIPDMKQKATVGYSVEAIVKTLDGVTNSQVDETGTTKPLVECITSGVIRGAVAMVGCNNPKIRPDYRSYRADEEAHRQRYHRHCIRMFRTGSCKSRSDGQEQQKISAAQA